MLTHLPRPHTLGVTSHRSTHPGVTDCDVITGDVIEPSGSAYSTSRTQPMKADDDDDDEEEEEDDDDNVTSFPPAGVVSLESGMV